MVLCNRVSKASLRNFFVQQKEVFANEKQAGKINVTPDQAMLINIEGPVSDSL